MMAPGGDNPGLAIDVRGLEKRFGEIRAVDGVDLQVPRGLIYGFLGPNGSGKTTTLRMICGLLKPDGGEGSCLGFDIRRDAPRIKRRIGYMTQRFSFYEDLSVEENLDFVARIYDVPDRPATIRHVMESLDLTARRTAHAGTLSGGWKQRVALAACLIHDPELLLLDEPTAGVDPEARRSFWNIIHDLAAGGITVLVTTHYMDEVERCHLISYLASGRVVTSGAPRSVARASGLVSFAVSGAGVRTLGKALEHTDAARSLSALGARTVVTGHDAAAIEAALRALGDDRLTWEQIEPGFEDVFVELTRHGTGRGGEVAP